MSRSIRTALTALAFTGACGVGVPAFAGVASAAPGGTSAVAGTAVPAGATAVGVVPASQQLTFQIWLTPDTVGAAQFADAVSTPGSPSYHQYLTPDAYTARFGPTPAAASEVASWLQSEGFSGVQASGQRDYVSATGSATLIDQAFAVHMTQYRSTGTDGKSVTFASNDTDLTVPTSISADVLSVTGLNTSPATPTNTSAATAPPSAPATPTPAPCSHYWAEHLQTLPHPFRGATQLPTTGCGYTAAQLRGVYGLTAANTGAGTTIALIEVGAPTEGAATLADYAKTNGLPAPTPTQYEEKPVGQGGACGNPFDGEEQLDSEAAYAMAPGADQLMIDGDSCASSETQALFDADTAVLDDSAGPLANIVSNSWDFGSETTPSGYPKTAHAIDLRAAAEGVGMYFASGDSPGVTGPSSDPYSIAVGGTAVGIGAQNNRVFETGWSIHSSLRQPDGTRILGGLVGGGGGTSQLYRQPAYQAGVVPASMSTLPNGDVDRAVPDVAADAALATPFLEGTIEDTAPGQPGPYTPRVNAGTSLSTPLVAGIVADAQQGQSQSFGFINPLLYSLAGTSALSDVLPEPASTTPIDDKAFGGLVGANYTTGVFDAEGRNTDQVTAPGYDTMTGLGTPNGTAFIRALRQDR